MKYWYHEPYFQLSSGDESSDSDLLFANEEFVPNRPIRTGKKLPRRFRLSIGESTPILSPSHRHQADQQSFTSPASALSTSGNQADHRSFTSPASAFSTSGNQADQQSFTSPASAFSTSGNQADQRSFTSPASASSTSGNQADHRTLCPGWEFNDFWILYHVHDTFLETRD